MYTIIFFGTSEFAVPALKKLAENNNFRILLVVTQPDTLVGRKKILAPTPIKHEALKLGLPTITPETLKNHEVVNKIIDVKPDFLVVAAYGKILPMNILQAARFGATNIHPSLLPKYRGPSPVQHAILNGDVETGTSIMLMDEQIDHGPILAQEKVEIEPNETAPELKTKLALVGAKLLAQTLPLIAQNKLRSKEQEHAHATFTKILTRTDGRIDWKRPAIQIYNMWRAFQPWPGIFSKTRMGNQELNVKLTEIKIAEAAHSTLKNMNAGEVFTEDKKLFVKCGDGAIEVKRVQLEGKKEVAVYDFLQGHHKIIGVILN